MRLKHLSTIKRTPYLQVSIICFSRSLLVSFTVISALLDSDVSLRAAAFATLKLDSFSYLPTTGNSICSRSLSSVGRSYNLHHYTHLSHLMFRRFRLTKNAASQMTSMANEKKRTSTYLNSTEYNTKRYAMNSGLDQQQQHRPLVIVLAGPTAVGKSDVAAVLCSSFTATDIILQHRQAQSRQNQTPQQIDTQGHVISADSVQVYRGVDIGANKPSAEERERTPHHLINVVDPPNQASNNGNKVSSYNAADWMRDAEYIIRQLTLFDDNNEIDNNQLSTLDTETVARRERINAFLHERLDEQIHKGSREPVLPVVVGGTMMYLTWLVHGRPDAIRPTTEAINRASNVVSSFDNKRENDEESAWEDASAYVASLGPVFSDRVSKLCGRDWYRLRRLLEVAFTIVHSKIQSIIPGGEKSNANNEADILRSLTDSEIYTGIRSGSLSDAGFDVRCFFLCPNERMSHFHTVDQRCEEMLLKGLLRETTDLYLGGALPEDSQVTRAIGYRQALEYLLRKDANMNDHDAFLSFVDDFATATRQYAKKQMQWFRKDSEFAFIPVDMERDKAERVKEVANVIAGMCQLSRKDFDAQLIMGVNQENVDATSSDKNLPISARTKLLNSQQGKGMKFFISKRVRLVMDSIEFRNALVDADECTRLIQNIK